MISELFFTVRDPIYGSITHFFFGAPMQAAKKLNSLGLDDLEVDLDYFDYDHGAFIFCGKENFLYVDCIPTQPEHFNTLAHEIYHCTCLVMDFLQVKYQEGEENEARAYYIGFLIGEVAKRL